MTPLLLSFTHKTLDPNESDVNAPSAADVIDIIIPCLPYALKTSAALTSAHRTGNLANVSSGRQQVDRLASVNSHEVIVQGGFMQQYSVPLLVLVSEAFAFSGYMASSSSEYQQFAKVMDLTAENKYTMLLFDHVKQRPDIYTSILTCVNQAEDACREGADCEWATWKDPAQCLANRAHRNEIFNESQTQIPIPIELLSRVPWSERREWHDLSESSTDNGDTNLLMVDTAALAAAEGFEEL